MEVVVTTGAIGHAKLQSNHYHQQTNTKSFYRPNALSIAQPTVSKHWRENITSYGLAYPKLTWGLPTLSLDTNSSWLPWRRVAMLYYYCCTHLASSFLDLDKLMPKCQTVWTLMWSATEGYGDNLNCETTCNHKLHLAPVRSQPPALIVVSWIDSKRVSIMRLSTSIHCHLNAGSHWYLIVPVCTVCIVQLPRPEFQCTLPLMMPSVVKMAVVDF